MIFCHMKKYKQTQGNIFVMFSLEQADQFFQNYFFQFIKIVSLIRLEYSHFYIVYYKYHFYYVSITIAHANEFEKTSMGLLLTHFPCKELLLSAV